LMNKGADIMFQPASDFSSINGLYLRAAAAEGSMAAGATVQTVATVAAEAVAVAGVGLTAFATTAQILAYVHYRLSSN